MGRLYDITKDYLYRKGLVEGRKQAKRELIESALATGEFSTEQIARYVKVAVTYVEAIAQELKK